MKHMAITSVAPNIVIAWRIAADTENKTNTHRKSLLHIIAHAIALMAVVETVPKADSMFAPKAVTKIVAIPVVIDWVASALALLAVVNKIVKTTVADAIMHPLAGTKYSIGITKNSNKG